MGDGWLGELGRGHWWQEGTGGSLVHGHVRSRALPWAEPRAEPCMCERVGTSPPMCVRVCARVEKYFFFLVNSYLLPETLMLQMKAVNFLLYVSVFKKL